MNFIRTSFISVYRARLYPNYWDMLALVVVLAIIILFCWNAKQMAAPYQIGQVIPISLDPSKLPFYAARTVVRMLIALLFSLLFTFTIGTWAAKSQRASRMLIPLIDVLQSVPILGYLSLVITAFIALFPNSLMGPECAAIFAIFTSQAWNMAIGFYQTLRSVPNEMREATRMFHLSSWQSFWRLDVPFSLPGLLWNTMASMSAGWFFVVASEAITAANQQILLPGIGSYIAIAIQAANLKAISFAVLTMFIVIIIYDQLLFRPLVAWSEKFRTDRESVGEAHQSESWVVDIFRRTRLMRSIGRKISLFFDRFVNLKWFRGTSKIQYNSFASLRREQILNVMWLFLPLLAGASALGILINYFIQNTSFHEIIHVLLLGLITAFRVFLSIFLCSLVWVPVGIWIGLRPKVANFAQPIAQILAAFPANLFYPFVVICIVTYHLSPNIWLTPLIVLGSQWYILFNVIAGASTIPKDLLQAVDNLGVSGRLRFTKLLFPGIFPYYITGAITAAGGAWNASIVAEVASWGNETVEATGLGAYITEYTSKGDFMHVALGIGMMCILVLIFNRMIWRPLYLYAENRFLLE